jgi:hypothetical protein
MKKALLILFLGISFIQLFAQERFVLNAAGLQNEHIMSSVGESLSVVIGNNADATWNGLLLISGSAIQTSVPYRAMEDASIYPNPARNHFRIRVGNNEQHYSNVEIMSMSGTKVLEFKNFNTQQNLDISQLQNGCYIIHLSDNKNKKNLTFKLIKR